MYVQSSSRVSRFFSLAVVLLCAMAVPNAMAQRTTAVSASGTGAYLPATGFYIGPGSDSFGDFLYSGTLEVRELGGGRFRFASADETLHEIIYEDGSAVSLRMSGIVRMTPTGEMNGNGDPLFTAEWNGQMAVVRGTGRFAGAKGRYRVTAVNQPFALTDPQWLFSWELSGRLWFRPVRDDGLTLDFQTGGWGSFDPANLGVGDPDLFPLVIGNGLGNGVYDGPTGFEFKLNGIPVCDGFDVHYGTAQSISLGILTPQGTIWYPGVDGDNPLPGEQRRIHIMQTRLGEIWFHKTGYFELDPATGIAGPWDFRIVGGTGLFEGATGTVYCYVQSAIEDITLDPPAAPFRYDFKGFITLSD